MNRITKVLIKCDMVHSLEKRNIKGNIPVYDKLTYLYGVNQISKSVNSTRIKYQ